ncbi:MAG: hypothetical protein ABIJ26_07455, partial [Candidatus Margulisiibacteriota bacterium]
MSSVIFGSVSKQQQPPFGASQVVEKENSKPAPSGGKPVISQIGLLGLLSSGPKDLTADEQAFIVLFSLTEDEFVLLRTICKFHKDDSLNAMQIKVDNCSDESFLIQKAKITISNYQKYSMFVEALSSYLFFNEKKLSMQIIQQQNQILGPVFIKTLQTIGEFSHYKEYLALLNKYGIVDPL